MKTKHLLLSFAFAFIFSIVSTTESFSQWVQKQSTLGQFRSGAVSWVINNKLYIVAGGPGQNLQEYDPATNSWTIKAALPWIGYRYLGVGFVINGKGYVCTGGDGNGIYDDLWKYDPVLDSWSAQASFPGGPRFLGFGFSIADKAYVGAGRNATSFFNDVYEYNSVTDTWTQKNNFPGGGRAHVAGTSLGNFGYVGAGVEFELSSGNFINHNDLFKYDPASDSWTPVASIPGPPRVSAVSFSSNNRVYAGLGGDDQDLNNANHFNDMHQYDPLTNSWDSLMSFTSARSEASGAAFGGKTYIMAGRFQTFGYSDLWALDDFTALNEHVEENKVSLYPSIVKNDFSVKLQPGLFFELKIFDPAGKEVLTEKEIGYNATINCSSLNNGLYLVRLLNENKIYSFKIIVSHH